MGRPLALLCLALVAPLLVPAVPAQVPQPTLVLGQPDLPSTYLPADESATLRFPWTYTLPAPTAGGATTSATLAIAVECTKDIVITGPMSYQIPLEPGVAEYSGSIDLDANATATTPVVEPFSCTIQGEVAGPPPYEAAVDDEEFVVTLAYQGLIEATVVDPNLKGDPQSDLTYKVEVTNLGNARTRVVFALLTETNGNWVVILPDDVIMEPGETSTVPFHVRTHYEAGETKGRLNITLQATPYSADVPYDPVTGEGPPPGPSVDIELVARVDGVYVPGPGVPLLLVLLVVAAIARRR